MSNSSSILAYSLTTLVGLGGALQGAEEDTAALTRRIERLEKQNAALKASYVQARSDADKAAAQLVDIRSRLEALGGAALGNSEERLIQAMADIEAFNDRVQRLSFHAGSVFPARTALRLFSAAPKRAWLPAFR